MVKLEEVVDEEFMREQVGPHDEDEWDTDSGTHQTPTHTHPVFPSWNHKC
jgi:import receptor subunit TOM22